MKDNDRLVLGPRDGTLPASTMQDGTPLEGQTPMPAFVPAPGDTASAALDRSLLSWPTPPFQVNFMTGYAPSWQRNLFYHLSITICRGPKRPERGSTFCGASGRTTML